MRLPDSKSLALVTVFLGVSAALFVGAKPADPAPGVFAQLGSASTLELPAQAARFVAEAPPEAQPRLAAEVIKASGALCRSAGLPAVVGAVCRAAPSVSSDVVHAAVLLCPEEAHLIVRAALSGAPGQVAAILQAACLASPSSFKACAVAAGEVAPQAGTEIIHGMADALPNLAPILRKARAYHAEDPMRVVMDRAVSLMQAEVGEASEPAARQRLAQLLAPASSTEPIPGALRLAADTTPAVAATDPPRWFQPPPRVGPPFTPAVDTSTEVNVLDSTVVTPGTPRDYSAP